LQKEMAEKEVEGPGGQKVAKDELGDAGDDGFWHAVDFKLNCPHIYDGAAMAAAANIHKVIKQTGCSICHDIRENWYCLKCGERFCGRYINAHGLEHFKDSGHPYFASLVDLSVWCYHCNEYVVHKLLEPIINEVHIAKFGVPNPAYKGNIGFIHDETNNKDGKNGEKDEKS